MQDILRAWTYINDPCNAGCSDCDSNFCRDYPAWSPIIEWTPNDPFETPPEDIPGYPSPPFYKISTPPPLSRLEPNDVLTDLTSTVFGGMTVIDLAELLLVTGFPRFRVNLEGEGELELHFLKIPNGGLALIQVDGDPLKIEVVDLSSLGVLDVVSLQALLSLLNFPEGLFPETIHEVKIHGTGSHFVDVTFLPNFGGSTVIGYGGGLRKLTLCGFNQEVEEMAFFDLRQNPLDPCEIQKMTTEGGEWVFAWRNDLCDESNSTTYNIQEQNNTILGDAIVNRYDGSDITTIHENLTITNYDGDGSLERTEALCMALNAYVKTYVSQWYQKASLALGLGFVGFILFSVPVIGWFWGAIVLAGAAYFASESLDAVRDDAAVEDVVCCMFDYLKGKAITPGIFSQALDTCPFVEGEHNYRVMEIVRSDLGQERNWLVFLDGLGRSFDLAQAGVSDCPCDDCSITIAFNDEDTGLYTIDAGTRVNGIGNPGYAILGESYTSGSQNGKSARVDVPTNCIVKTVRFDIRFTHGSLNNNVGVTIQAFQGGIIVQEASTTLSLAKNQWHTVTRSLLTDCDYVRVGVAFQNTIPASTDNKYVRLDNVRINP